MGRGLGKWQRLILELVHGSPNGAICLNEWICAFAGGGEPCQLEPSSRSALNRAAHTLEQRGLVGLKQIWGRTWDGRAVLVLGVFLPEGQLPDRTRELWNGTMAPSNRELAKLLHASPSTVSRWLSVDDVQPDAPVTFNVDESEAHSSGGITFPPSPQLKTSKMGWGARTTRWNNGEKQYS